MIPAEWTARLAPEIEWREAYATVAEQAKLHLQHNVLVGEEVSTAELVEAMFPQALARGDGITARRRIFKALEANATRALKGYCHKGASRKATIGNRQVRPWRWHPPMTLGEVQTIVHPWDAMTAYKAGDRFLDGKGRLCSVLAS